ncbi:MAG: tetratricopeptide repeat protein [Endomicrobiales bacterium]|nr:tetratricopeptide repeat protein [Endomicrobiales bacterium]
MIRYIFGLTFIFLFLLSGCIATSTEVSGLREDIYKLQLKINELQTNQADVSNKTESFSRKLDILGSNLKETQNRMSSLGQKLDDVDANFSQRLDKLFEQLSGTTLSIAPSPSALYNLAYNDYSNGKYDLAITGFETYLEKYPDTELSDKANYYLADSYYSKKSFDDAITKFELFLNNKTNMELSPSVLYKLADCYEKIGNGEKTKTLLKQLYSEFPDSQEAKMSAQKVQTKGQDAQKP